MANVIDSIDDAVQTLARSYSSEMTDKSIEHIMNDVLAILLCGIATETGQMPYEVFPTLIALMNAKEAPAKEGSNVHVVYSEEFRKRWGYVNK